MTDLIKTWKRLNKSFWTIDKSAKRLKDCKNCENYVKDSFDEVENSLVCGRLKDSNAHVNVWPSNWIKGFKNGELIIFCRNYPRKFNIELN